MTNHDPEAGGGRPSLPPTTWTPGPHPGVPRPEAAPAGSPGPYPHYQFPPPAQPGTGPPVPTQHHGPGGPPPAGYGFPGPGQPYFEPPGQKGGGRTGLWVGLGIAAGVAALVGIGFLVTPRSSDPDVAVEDDDSAAWEQAREAGAGAKPTSDEAACLDERLGGSATLDEVMTNPDGEAREELAQAMIDCAEDPARSDLLIQSMAGNMELGAGGQIDVDDDEASCVIQYVLDNSPNPARTISVGDGPGDEQLFLDAFERCLDDEDLAVMMRQSGAGPQAYGDDPRLDLLWDDCDAGDDRACDILYVQSSVGSDYEQFAFDCAGRGLSTGGGCVEGITYDSLGYVDENDPGLAAQIELCQGGDMTACDFVFIASTFGSEVNDIGFTCGGRIAIGALPDCRTRFGE